MRNIARSALCALAAACLLLTGCRFLEVMGDDEDGLEYGELSLGAAELSLDIGSMEILSVSLEQNQSRASIKWEFDESIVSGKYDSYGIVLTGLSQGQTVVTASCAGQKRTCVVTVSSNRHTVSVENPYIYASVDVVNVEVGGQAKIFASAFGNDNNVISSWSFSCDNSAVASLYTEGNYCWITGVKTGQARITISNSKVSAYPYTVLVNSCISSVKTPYITTGSNVVSINLSDTSTAEFSVELKNPVETSRKNDFEYKLVDSDGNDVLGEVFTVDEANGNFKVSASGQGMAVLRVSHQDASYDLDIVLRAASDADLASIATDSSIVTIDGDYTKTISFRLENLPDGVYADDTKWTYKYSDGADYYATFTESGGDVAVTPLACGMLKITAMHPSAGISCSVAVIIKNLTSSAASASTYITTSQNYMTLSVDSDAVPVTVSIYNAKQGGESGLKWSIESDADDGSGDQLVEFTGGDGYAVYSSAARASYTLAQNLSCTGYIRPLGKTGTARITLSHPDALYPSEIIVHIKSDAEEDEPLVLSADRNIVTLTPGDTAVITASLTGSAKAEGDENSIEWSCSSSDLSFTGEGGSASVSLPEAFTGSGTGYITVSSQKASNEARIPVMYAGSAEELSSLRMIYASGSNLYTMSTSDSPRTVILGTSGLDESDLEKITWTVVSGNISVVTADVLGYDSIRITPVAKGAAVVKASAEGIGEVVYYFTVTQAGVIDSKSDCYLTTGDNVVYFSEKGASRTFSVAGVNISAFQMRNCWYKVEPEGLYSLIYDNGTFTAEALTATGEARVTVGHDLSENELRIVLRTGDEYEYVNPDIAYISSGVQSLQMLDTDGEEMLTFAVVHTASDEMDEKGFAFSLKDGTASGATSASNSVVSISYAPDGSVLLVRPEGAGVTEIYVDHEGCLQLAIPVTVSSEVSVENIPYITTGANVITVIEGEYTPVTAELKNCQYSAEEDWTWIAEDFDVASVAVSKGSTVMLLGKKAGNTTLRVSNSNVSPEYALSLTVICIDKAVAQTRPYIQLSKNVVTLATGESMTVTAEMVGGSASDSLYFDWTCSDTSVAFVSGGSDTALIKGLKEGITAVTVSNAKYPVSEGYYSKRLVVRVEDDESEGRYISLSRSNLTLSPDGTEGTRITASLVNSTDDTDGQDFVWWVDDPTLVEFSSNAATALVVPTGLSGTTVIHCKHSKALRTADAIVYVSRYTEFAFPFDTLSAQEGKVYFLGMKVPETEAESYVEYESPDADVCVIEGTKSVCYLEGTGQGSVILTAHLKNKATGKTISSASMPVNVIASAAGDIEISVPSSILTVKTGESAEITASISGTGILSEAAALDLKWRWATEGVTEDMMYILKPTSQEEASGPSIKLTAKQAGDYILECYYKKDGIIYSASILVTVPESKEKRITIPTSFTQYKGEDPFTITASITNGDSGDLQNIRWTAGKYNGKSILKLTTVGESTTVTASGIGNSVIYASLADGTVSNPCIVIIKPDATFSFNSRTVHVLPGFSEEVSYELDPDDTNLVFESVGTNGLNASDYYTYEIDSVSKKVSITGKKAYEGVAVGTLSAVILGKSGGSSIGGTSTLSVYVEQNPSLETSLVRYIYIQNPDTEVKSYMPTSGRDGKPVLKSAAQVKKEKSQREFTYTAWPADMDVEIKCLRNGAEVTGLVSWVVEEEISADNGRSKKTGKVTLTPHAECGSGDGVTLVLTGSPGEGSAGTYSDVVVSYPLIMTYDDYELRLVTKDLQSGAFTGYDSQKGITLGDGEELVFALDIDRSYNENASAPEIVSKEYAALNGPTATKDNLPVSDGGYVSLSDEGSSSGSGAASYLRLKHSFDHMQFTPSNEKNGAAGGWTDAQRAEDPENPEPAGTKVLPEYFYISEEMLLKLIPNTYTFTEYVDKEYTEEIPGFWTPYAYWSDYYDDYNDGWRLDLRGISLEALNFDADTGEALISWEYEWDWLDIKSAGSGINTSYYYPDYSEGRFDNSYYDERYISSMVLGKCTKLTSNDGKWLYGGKDHKLELDSKEEVSFSDLSVDNTKLQSRYDNDRMTWQVYAPVKTNVTIWYTALENRTVVATEDFEPLVISGRWVGEEHKHKKSKYWGKCRGAYYVLSNNVRVHPFRSWEIGVDEYGTDNGIHDRRECELKFLKFGVATAVEYSGSHRHQDANTYQEEYWEKMATDVGHKILYKDEPDYFIPRSEIEEKHTGFYVFPGQKIFQSTNFNNNTAFKYAFPGYIPETSSGRHYGFPQDWLYYPLRKYMAPACSPDESPAPDDKLGQIKVEYMMKNSDGQYSTKVINVAVKVRQCPAYTNSGWKKYSVSYAARRLESEVRWYREQDIPVLKEIGYEVTEMDN